MVCHADSAKLTYMAFYIVAKGRLTPYHFPYLDENVPIRLEATLVPGQPRPTHETQRYRDFYAYELMTKMLVTMSPAARISEAKKLMHEKKIHHLPMVIDHKITGLISSKDLANLHEDDDLERVSHRMSKLVLCASDTTPLRHVVEVFYRENINALPLVDEELKLVGIITHRDILKWLLENKKTLKH